MGYSDEYLAVEQAAYEAAIVPELWPQLLRKLGQISDSAGAAILCMNERGPHLVASPEMQPLADRFVAEGWMTRNGRAGGVVARGLVGSPRFLTEEDYFDSPGDAQSDAMVRDLFRAEGYGWAAGFVVELPHGDLMVMNVEQRFERGPIRGDALARLDEVYSPLARAAMLAGRADFERVRTAVDMLTALGLPAAALTPSGRVTLANDAFAGATQYWTTGHNERLGLHDRVAHGMLMTALDTVGDPDSFRSIPLRHEIGGTIAATIQVVPIRRSAHDVFGSTTALVVLSDLRAGVPSSRVVQSLFDLTPAELVVAKGIAAGLSPAEIARQNNRSVMTVRNQLKSAMSKTGCSRQIELALLVRQLSS